MAQDLPLLNRALEFFGSWDSALKAAGFGPIKVRRQAILNRCRYPCVVLSASDVGRRNDYANEEQQKASLEFIIHIQY